jgi:hypothetical protein
MRLKTIGLALSILLASGRLAFANCATDDPTGSKTAAARSSAEQTCAGMNMGCTTATTHGAYVSCIAHAANDLVTAGTLPKSCKGAVKKCAAHSTCGKPGAVTCCFTTTKGTKCKIKKDAAHCTAKQGTVGTCDSCCDACPAPGSGPSCPVPTTTTTAPTTTTTVACTACTGSTPACPGTGTPCTVDVNGFPCASGSCDVNGQCCGSAIYDVNGQCCASGSCDVNGQCCASSSYDVNGHCCASGLCNVNGQCCS